MSDSTIISHFQNLYSVLTDKSIRPSKKISTALVKCKSDNIDVLCSLDNAREFLTLNPWINTSTICKMCCILPTQLGELLSHLNMHVVNVFENLTLVLPTDDLITAKLSTRRLEFSTRFLKSLKDGQRHFYFGYLKIESTVIRVMWGSCGQFRELSASEDLNDDFRSWMSICIINDEESYVDREKKVKEWLAEILGYSNIYCKFRLAVYNKNTCTISNDSFMFQGLLKCNFLACDLDCLDPFTLYMNQVILYIASTVSKQCFSKCKCIRDKGELCPTLEKLRVDIYKTFDNKTLNPIMFDYVEKLKRFVAHAGC